VLLSVQALAAPTLFPIKLRIPEWCASTATLKVNGKDAPLVAGARGFATVLRTWKQGDTLALQFPMVIKVHDDPCCHFLK